MEISIFHEPKLPIEVERNAHFFPKKLPTDFGPVPGSLWFLSSARSNLSVIGHGLRFGSFAAKPTGVFVWSLVVFQGAWGGNHWPSREKIVPDSRSSHVLLQHNFLMFFFFFEILHGTPGMYSIKGLLKSWDNVTAGFLKHQQNHSTMGWFSLH